MDTRKVYDISREELAALKERNERRNALRQEYQKKKMDPYRQASGSGVLFDPALQRYMAARNTAYEHFKPTAKSGLQTIAMLIVPFGLLAWLMKSTRDTWEHQYRTGQVSYADRKNKFV